jgi:3-phenylpropionate/trans-cinnamate dioxygenase ferredoxin reductase subunit
VPYFFSDLADWASMEYVGPGSGDTVIRGSLDDGEFVAFYLDEEQVKAALSVGRSDDLDEARRFISEKTKVDESKLADTETDLSSL